MWTSVMRTWMEFCYAKIRNLNTEIMSKIPAIIHSTMEWTREELKNREPTNHKLHSHTCIKSTLPNCYVLNMTESIKNFCNPSLTAKQNVLELLFFSFAHKRSLTQFWSCCCLNCISLKRDRHSKQEKYGKDLPSLHLNSALLFFYVEYIYNIMMIILFIPCKSLWAYRIQNWSKQKLQQKQHNANKSRLTFQNIHFV